MYGRRSFHGAFASQACTDVPANVVRQHRRGNRMRDCVSKDWRIGGEVISIVIDEESEGGSVVYNLQCHLEVIARMGSAKRRNSSFSISLPTASCSRKKSSDAPISTHIRLRGYLENAEVIGDPRQWLERILSLAISKARPRLVVAGDHRRGLLTPTTCSARLRCRHMYGRDRQTRRRTLQSVTTCC